MKHNPRGQYPFPNIAPFLDSKITDLATLRQHLPSSILVALTTCGTKQHFDGPTVPSLEISEIGIAVYQAREDAGPHFFSNITQSYEQNDIEAFTIRIREKHYGPAAGTMTHVSSDTEAGPFAELEWITTHCPSITHLFTNWTDLQDLLPPHYHGHIPNPRCKPAQCKIGLYPTLKGLRLSGWRSKHQRHQAANDAIKILALLTGLTSNTPFKPTTKEVGISFYSFLPLLQPHRTNQRRQAFNARISAAGGAKLPVQTPQGLRRLCERHAGLMAVGLNARNEMMHRGPVRFWWASFESAEALGGFVDAMRGLRLEGRVLCVRGNWNGVVDAGV
ncbi:hypothetical protein J1614_000332 [Plenodomus biglobosus]|nr:hypothetical protein J1614_000332 [Plenodomus biglobosus]